VEKNFSSKHENVPTVHVPPPPAVDVLCRRQLASAAAFGIDVGVPSVDTSLRVSLDGQTVNEAAFDPPPSTVLRSPHGRTFDNKNNEIQLLMNVVVALMLLILIISSAS